MTHRPREVGVALGFATVSDSRNPSSIGVADSISRLPQDREQQCNKTKDTKLAAGADLLQQAASAAQSLTEEAASTATEVDGLMPPCDPEAAGDMSRQDGDPQPRTTLERCAAVLIIIIFGLAAWPQ